MNPHVITGGIAAAGIGTYGAASRYAPGATTTALMAGGAYAGYKYAGRAGGALRGASRAGVSGYGIRAQRGTARAATGVRRGLAATRRAMPARFQRGRIGGGIAGAAAGLVLGAASKALFGPTKRSNYGYR